MNGPSGEGPVSSFAELHDRLSRLRNGWVFRGHTDGRWPLLPKAGREPYLGHEEVLFRSWKQRAIEHVSGRYESDWDWLAIAQHHGLATRLLDWTVNPLNAAFFAVWREAGAPAVIHAARFAERFSVSADLTFESPFECDGIAMYRPRGVVPRIGRQGGLFTVHGPPDRSFEGIPRGIAAVERIEIAQTYRNTLLSELAFFGVTSASLFPDLDGLSAFLNWSVESGEYLG